MRWTTRNRFAPSQEEAMSVGNLSDVAQIMEAILFSLTVIYIAIEAKQDLNLTKAQ